MISHHILLFFLIRHTMEQPRIPTSIEPVLQNEDVYFYKPREDLWLLQTAKGVPVSIYVLEGSEKALVIDTGNSIKNLKENIEKVTKKPAILALTHAHHDHTGSCNEFDTVYMHMGDKEMLEKQGYTGKIETIKPGHIFDLGDREVQVIEMFGHTTGSIGFLDKKGKFLVAGDSIGHTVCWMHLTKLPLESLLGVLRHLDSIKDQYTEIYTGHYNQSNRPLDHQYVKDLLDLVQNICYTNDVHAEPFEWREKLDFQPMIAYGNNGVGVVYNPNRRHFV
ncbi:Beta-lactamase domain protein [Tritrichomonas foetus]|uniref:Beta-lactamase domain protein n=1 Tax=Tritrichomonas foetus TaxID=1144522 RepID=A0A1J4KSK5_9EUKA|nr:Beta-lactamase domain protein [Tritrichomonas foetus]|eukprot:OHT14273.1 Beta-lactamase domain protein [Tritrichomonas foetus]